MNTLVVVAVVVVVVVDSTEAKQERDLVQWMHVWAPRCTWAAEVSFRLFFTEVNAKLVPVCGNRRLQDVYVISPFFACISADRAPAFPLCASFPLPLPRCIQPLYRCTRGTVYNAAINGRRRVLTTGTKLPLFPYLHTAPHRSAVLHPFLFLNSQNESRRSTTRFVLRPSDFPDRSKSKRKEGRGKRIHPEPIVYSNPFLSFISIGCLLITANEQPYAPAPSFCRTSTKPFSMISNPFPRAYTHMLLILKLLQKIEPREILAQRYNLPSLYQSEFLIII